MADDFPLDIAQLVALIMESVFYGIYLVSFAACMRVLFSGAGIKSTANKIMLLVALSLGTVATMDFGFGFRHVLVAFIYYKGPGGALEELNDIGYWVDVIKQATYVAQTVIADLMLIYRCYMVYDKRWLVIAGPFIIWFATLVCGCAVIYISSHLRVSTNVNNSHLTPFITSTLVLTLVQNLATTSMLAWRIWAIDRRISQYRSTRQSRLKPLLRTIIESGAIYTLTALMFLIAYLCSNNAQYPISDCGVQIIGIVFNMIIIRMHQGRTAELEATNTTRGTSLAGSGTLHSQPHSALSKAQTRSTTASHHPMKPVTVNVARQVTRDGEDDHESAFGESNAHIEGKEWPAV